MPLLASLGYLASFGQVAELAQGHVHQREQVQWSRRNYHRDVQALTVDLLGAARDDIRGTYDTYVERVNTLLLLNALLLPFAFSILQFSDKFILQTEDQCAECFEAHNPWVATVWAYLGGFALVLPFWSLLMLFWCKIKTDSWIEKPLEELQKLRKKFVDCSADANASPAGSRPLQDTEAYEGIVRELGHSMVYHQEEFTGQWERRCAPLVKYATWLLWIASYISVLLVAWMFWIFLLNQQDTENSFHFAGVIVVGMLVPVLLFLYDSCRNKEHTPPAPPAPPPQPAEPLPPLAPPQPPAQPQTLRRSLSLQAQQQPLSFGQSQHEAPTLRRSMSWRLPQQQQQQQPYSWEPRQPRPATSSV